MIDQVTRYDQIRDCRPAPEPDNLGPIIGRRFACGCDTTRPPSERTRCPRGWELYQTKQSRRTDRERHACLAKIAHHQSTEGQREARECSG